MKVIFLFINTYPVISFVSKEESSGEDLQPRGESFK